MRARVKSSVASTFYSAINGYSSLTSSHSNIALQDTNVSYVLLPVYLITAQYNGETYTYAVNGQTGKIVGDLPADKGKATRTFVGTALGVAAAVLALLTFVF